MNMDSDKLATELLHEVKLSAKRWFIAFCIMVGVEISTIIGFMWYISLPSEEEVTKVEQTATDNENTNVIGGDYYGQTDTDNQLQTESD